MSNTLPSAPTPQPDIRATTDAIKEIVEQLEKTATTLCIALTPIMRSENLKDITEIKNTTLFVGSPLNLELNNTADRLRAVQKQLDALIKDSDL